MLRSPQEVDLALEQKAAQLTVAAGLQTFTVRMSLRADDLDFGLSLLDDLVRRARLDADRLEIVRGQMIEGVRRQNDDPGDIARRLLDKAVYGDHLLGHAATVSSLNSITRAQLLERYQNLVQPSEVWIGVSGDYDRQALIDRLDRMLAGWPVTSGLASPKLEVPQTINASTVWVVDKKIPQTTILMGDLGISKDAADLHAVRIMNYILGGGGFNSQLMREVRSNRGLAYSVYSFFQVGRQLPGKFVASAETKNESTVEVLELMQQLMRQMSTADVRPQDLTLAKDSLINSFIFAFEGTHPVVEQQMRLDYYGYPADYMQNYRTKVAAVTAEQVKQAAQDRVRVDQLKVVLVGDMGVLRPALDEAGIGFKEITPTIE